MSQHVKESHDVHEAQQALPCGSLSTECIILPHSDGEKPIDFFFHLHPIKHHTNAAMCCDIQSQTEN